MTRLLLSLFIGLGLGAGLGLYLGWVQFPAEVIDSPASALAPQYQDEYTVMIARGYLVDGDSQGALERMRLLALENIPVHVQELAERYISNSRNVDDTLALIALADGMGRLTPLMREYRERINP